MIAQKRRRARESKVKPLDLLVGGILPRNLKKISMCDHCENCKGKKVFAEGALLGAVLGAGLGALVGVLFAPDSGTATRKKIKEKGGEYMAEGRERIEELSDKVEEVEDKMQEAIATYEDKIAPFKDKLGSEADKLKKKFFKPQE